ncbi:MAG: WHG domain-containing protein [Lachnospiraceae bacterium]|nr:WHG domain-containing protein [Lachnospiraceae bacterium]
MAPRNKYTRNEMVEAAVRVVRKKGIDALTAKALASELGVSTQPVFTCFHTIDEARREVRAAAEQIYDSYIAEGLQMQPPFFGVGMQYIRFSREEPELYRLMFLTAGDDGKNSFMNALGHSQDLVRESLMETYHMDAPTADRYFRDLWLVVHGLATLIVSGECSYSEQEIGGILTGFSLSVCKAIKEIPGFVEGTFDRDKEFHKLLDQ